MIRQLLSPRVLLAFNFALFALSAWFIWIFVDANFASLHIAELTLNLEFLGLCLVIIVSYLGYQIALWRRLMGQLGRTIPWPLACRFYFTNNILAYIPGKVANLIGIAALATRFTVPTMQAAKAVILFQIYALVSGTAVVGVISLAGGSAIGAAVPPAAASLLVFSSLIGLVALSPTLVGWTLALTERVLARPVGTVALSYKTHLANITMYAAGWFVFGAIYWAMLGAFGEAVEISDLAPVIAIATASYLLGLVAFTLPAGLGVREAGLAYGFLTLFPGVQAVSVVIVSRLILLTITILAFATVTLVIRPTNISSEE